ncbi:hypothetical protein ACC761_18380 [Rhizobium ruizarguesonis]
MINQIVPEQALAAGKAAYAQMMADDAIADAAHEKWRAMSAEEQIYAVTLEALKAEPGFASFPFWTIFTSIHVVVEVEITGALILPKCPFPDSDIPRRSNYRKILAAAAKLVKCRDRGFVRTFLRDVCFQSCLSTNGRRNPDTGLFDRYGVRSVEEWSNPPFAKGTQKVPERTFHRIKNQLVKLGLIQAEQHMWNNTKCLWIKATGKLSRIVFEDGYWENVRPKAVKSKPAANIINQKPRGLSAIHKQRDVELRGLYDVVISADHKTMPKPHRWALFDLLTQPIALSDKIEKRPFAPPGTARFKRLQEALDLAHFPNQWG